MPLYIARFTQAFPEFFPERLRVSEAYVECPIRVTLGGCARATSGEAIVPPTSAMNSRRRIASSRRVKGIVGLNPALWKCSCGPNVGSGSWPCENAWRKHRRAAISARWPCAVIFPDWRLFRSGSAPEADSRRLERFCNSRRTRVCDDYALITAMSGWTPKMFMTRVRL